MVWTRRQPISLPPFWEEGLTFGPEALEFSLWPREDGGIAGPASRDCATDYGSASMPCDDLDSAPTWVPYLLLLSGEILS